MEQLLSDPRGLIILLCFVGVVVGLNLTLLGVLRGNRDIRAETAKWGQAFGGARAASQRQNAQMDELRRAVEALKPPAQPRAEDEAGER